MVALTHIGFTEDPKSVEVDANVDTNMAAAISGLDVILGSHSHTNPTSGSGAYKYLPTFVAGPDGTPVLINQAYRYNNTLGEVVIGVHAKAGGGYDVVSRAAQNLSVALTTPEERGHQGDRRPLCRGPEGHTMTRPSARRLCRSML